MENIMQYCSTKEIHQYIFFYLGFILRTLTNQRAILENYFERQSPTRDSTLTIYLGCTGSCEPPGRVQMHSPVREHWQSAVKHSMVRVFKTS